MAAAAPATTPNIEKPANVTEGLQPADAMQPEEKWKPLLALQCDFTVDLPMPDFKIGDLLKLRRGSVINAHFRLGRDVPLCLNGALLGWIEFELVGEQLAVRLTELA
jgi:flagellar motor switch/type III secretory pathway protein FliN